MHKFRRPDLHSRLSIWCRHLGRSRKDLLLLTASGFATYIFAVLFDSYEGIHQFAEAHEAWQLDEIMTAFFLLPIGTSIYAFRRNQDLKREKEAARKAELEVQRLATHDALTGLPNRRKLARDLEQCLSDNRDLGQALCLIQIDMDHFKHVNERHGHAIGDQILQFIAMRLAGVVRRDDIVAKRGGDEFTVVAQLSQGLGEAARIAARILDTLQSEFDVNGISIHLGASLGVAVAPVDATDAATLHRRADTALQWAKAEGRGRIRFFEPKMDASVQERIRLRDELQPAIQAGHLEPYFQPLINLETQEIVGFEVLARWQHATLGQVPPCTFISLAEDSGLIGALTRSILKRACYSALNWPAHLVIAVNLSPLQLSDPTLVDSVISILAETGFPPHRLELEITESALVGDVSMAQDIVRALKAMGMRIALDDFGTGYSSLIHLRSFPFDKIKVDASFVRSMTTETDSRKIVSAVIGLGRNLGMTVLAEGIEVPEQAEVLRELGCPLGQGWLYGKAVPASAAAAMVDALLPAIRTSLSQ